VYLTTVTFNCPQSPAVLTASPVAVRIAKADSWVYLAPPGSFG
jgi:hypothetical protein